MPGHKFLEGISCALDSLYWLHTTTRVPAPLRMANTSSANSSSRSSGSHIAKLLPQSPQDSPVRVYSKKADQQGANSSNNGATAAGVALGGSSASSWDVEQADQSPTHSPSKQLLSASLAPAMIQKLIYGLGASFGFNALVVSNGTLMDYYEKTYGLSTSFLSLADFLAGSLTLYAVVGFGYWSDITTSSYGRRKPFVVFFTPLLAFSLIMLFTPKWAPTYSSTGTETAAWFGVFYTLEQVSVSSMTVVIAAWGTSLTHAVNERASLYTIDAIMDLFGFCAGVLITAVGTPAKTGVALAFIFLFQNLLLVSFLRDEQVTTGATAGGAARRHHVAETAIQVPFIAGLHMSFENKEFLTLFKAALFGSIVGTTVNLLPIFFQVVMRIGDDAIESVYSIYAQLVIISAFFAVLSTATLNARWGKIRTLQFGVGCGAVYGLIAFCASYASVVELFYLSSVPAGMFAGIVAVNGNVLLSNSIDYDQLKTGFRRQSLYQCLIYVPMTFVSVAGSSIPLSIITAFGGLEAGQTPPSAVVLTLRLWVSLVVTGCLLASYRQLSAFKLTEAVQQDVSAQLRRREQGQFLPPRDPIQEEEDESGENTLGVEGEIELSQDVKAGENSSSGGVNGISSSGEGKVRVDVEVENDPPSASVNGPWYPMVAFLELNFSSQELALLTLDNGKQWKLGTYLLNLLACAFYAVILFVQTVVAVDQRDDLTGAMIFVCFLMLASSVAIYEGGRFHAMKEVYYMGDGRDVARWARQRLTARKNVRPWVLYNPFRLVLRTVIAHVGFSIVLLSVVFSLHLPLKGGIEN